MSLPSSPTAWHFYHVLSYFLLLSFSIMYLLSVQATLWSVISIPLTLFTYPFLYPHSWPFDNSAAWTSFPQFFLSTQASFFSHVLLPPKLQASAFFCNLQTGLSAFLSLYLQVLLLLWNPSFPPPSCMHLSALHFDLRREKLGTLFAVI